MRKKWGGDLWSCLLSPILGYKLFSAGAIIWKWKDFLGTFHICFSSRSFGNPSMNWHSRNALWHSRHISHALWHSSQIYDALWHVQACLLLPRPKNRSWCGIDKGSFCIQLQSPAESMNVHFLIRLGLTLTSELDVDDLSDIYLVSWTTKLMILIWLVDLG